MKLKQEQREFLQWVVKRYTLTDDDMDSLKMVLKLDYYYDYQRATLNYVRTFFDQPWKDFKKTHNIKY